MDVDKPAILKIADLVIDLNNYTFTQCNTAVYLTKKELKILYLLASNPFEVHTRQAIFDYAWGENVLVGSRTIDVHIRRLRAKIGAAYILTVKGVGYKFNK